MAIVQDIRANALAGSPGNDHPVSGLTAGMGIVAITGVAGTFSLLAGVLAESVYAIVAGVILMAISAGATYLTDRKRQPLV